ncbi:CDP-alcohol phosphatidyltransferase family protein [Methylopila henanensis]|uniref:CDP-alcohol phosphatidyltransferase family protein n=1 Tax=Methylopila henanensis TaxID=873516 RepID=A0ABW4KC46_9HYPH
MQPDALKTGGEPARRPIASRSSGWAIALSRRLAASSVTPNQISVASVVFAGFGAALIALGATPLAWLAAAVCVQLRLVCNLLDGMVAVEGGKKSAVGAIYNEFPDRVADTLLLVPVGYAAGLPWLGWAAALLAALTAYVRVFGGSLGLAQSFDGVMAKQRRMAALTLGLVAQSVEWTVSDTRWSLLIAIAVVAAGSLVTCWTRSAAIADGLRRA